MEENLAKIKEKWSKVLAEQPTQQEQQMAYFALGMLAYQEQQFRQALSFLLPLWEMAPNHLGVAKLIACSYLELQNDEQALLWCDQLIKLNSNEGVAHYNRGVVLARLNQEVLAREAFLRAIHLDPSYIDAYLNLAALALKNRDTLLAKQYYREICRVDVHNEIARYMLAALDENQMLVKAPLEYVEQLYEGYANHYEQQMLGVLDYQAPKVLLDCLKKYSGVEKARWRTLDLGCGTGLVSDCFSDFYSEIIGVDISSAMIEKAKNKNRYTALVRKSMEAYLHETDEKFDLIIAADSLIYTGDLSHLFEGVCRVLNQGAWFIFSIESQEKNKFYLQENGRYAHSIDYIQEIGQKNKINFSGAKEVILRYQEGKPVLGKVVVFHYVKDLK